jgi:hypothetical protein
VQGRDDRRAKADLAACLPSRLRAVAQARTSPSTARSASRGRTVTRELGLSPDIVNVEGGAIAHGHPIGATGAVLTTRLIHSMRRDGLRRGIVTLCIGGGQGIALALETIN